MWPAQLFTPFLALLLGQLCTASPLGSVRKADDAAFNPPADPVPSHTTGGGLLGKRGCFPLADAPLTKVQKILDASPEDPAALKRLELRSMLETLTTRSIRGFGELSNVKVALLMSPTDVEPLVVTHIIQEHSREIACIVKTFQELPRDPTHFQASLKFYRWWGGYAEYLQAFVRDCGLEIEAEDEVKEEWRSEARQALMTTGRIRDQTALPLPQALRDPIVGHRASIFLQLWMIDQFFSLLDLESLVEMKLEQVRARISLFIPYLESSAKILLSKGLKYCNAVVDVAGGLVNDKGSWMPFMDFLKNCPLQNDVNELHGRIYRVLAWAKHLNLPLQEDLGRSAALLATLGLSLTQAAHMMESAWLCNLTGGGYDNLAPSAILQAEGPNTVVSRLNTYLEELLLISDTPPVRSFHTYMRDGQFKNIFDSLQFGGCLRLCASLGDLSNPGPEPSDMVKLMDYLLLRSKAFVTFLWLIELLNQSRAELESCSSITDIHHRYTRCRQLLSAILAWGRFGYLLGRLTQQPCPLGLLSVPSLPQEFLQYSRRRGES